jgi:GNAT superfamily N-acetyltransferase
MIAVRQANAKDVEAAVEVVRRSITELCSADHKGDADTLTWWLSNKTAQHLASWFANSDNHCVIAAAASRVLGVGLLHRSGEIRLLYLTPGAQRQGIGKAIHTALEGKAKEWGLERLRLDSTALACAFYEKLGYRSVAPPKLRFGVLHSHPYEKALQPNSALLTDASSSPLRAQNGAAKRER